MGAQLEPTRLLRHPGFEVAPPPAIYTSPKEFNQIVKWTLENAARFISPSPKEDGEDEEFVCDDLADALRTKLSKVLMIRYKDNN